MTSPAQIHAANRPRSRAVRRSVFFALATTLILIATGCQPPVAPPAPPGEPAGNFAIRCSFTHRLADDPIVKPGQAGASHSHDFFGNRSTNAATTLASLQAANTSCGDGQDRSGYWVPSLNVNGVLINPIRVEAYYQGFGIEGQVKPFPTGLKLVAGDATATSAQGEVTTWRCDAFGGQDFVSPPSCESSKLLTMVVRFPDCWDGVNLDSANHKSHLTNSFRTRATRGSCPTTHPVKVPRLRLAVQYPLSGPVNLTLASGGVFSGHADFFNAWNAGRLADRVCQQINHNVGCTVGNAVAAENDPAKGRSGDSVNLDTSVSDTTPTTTVPMPTTVPPTTPTTVPPTTVPSTTVPPTTVAAASVQAFCKIEPTSGAV